MSNTLLAWLLAILPVCALAQQTSPPGESARQDGVVQRGEQQMGFSQDATTHHFRLFKDGGEMLVEANDPNDKASIEQIRIHMSHLVNMFSNGNFNAPTFIHGSNPPGVATMTRLKSDIRYTVTETDRGARIRILTSSSETTDAVHAFLLFQIIDHKTADSPAIAG
jgi:hypothetical protein